MTDFTIDMVGPGARLAMAAANRALTYANGAYGSEQTVLTARDATFAARDSVLNNAGFILVSTDLALGGASKVGIVSTNIANVNLVGGSITNVNAVAGIVNNINAVAAIATATVGVYTIRDEVVDLYSRRFAISGVYDIRTAVTSAYNNLSTINAVGTDLALGAGSYILRAPAMAGAAANSASQAALSAQIAMNAIGSSLSLTNAEMQTKLAAAADLSYAQVYADEVRNGQRSLYRKVSGAWSYIGSLNGVTVYNPSIEKWHRKWGPTKYVAMVGDSTYAQIVVGAGGTILPSQCVGGELEGVQFQNFGHSGVSMEAWITSPATYIDELKTAHAATPFDVILFRLGINGTRTGGSPDAASYALKEVTVINLIRDALPGVPIVRVIPNSFRSLDPNGSLFVQPNTAVASQLYSDIMEQGTLLNRGLWPDVVICNTRDQIFAHKVQASLPNMSDQIHPTSSGNIEEMRLVQQQWLGRTQPFFFQKYRMGNEIIEGPQVFNRAEMKQAIVNQGLRRAPIEYPLMCFDTTQYDCILQGYSAATTAGQANFVISNSIDGPDNQYQATCRVDDVIVQFTPAGPKACLVPYGATCSNNGDVNAQFNGLGTTGDYALAASNIAHPALLFRHKNAGSAKAVKYANNRFVYPNRYTFRVFNPVNGAVSFAQSPGGPAPHEWQPNPGDIIVCGETVFVLDTTMTLATDGTATRIQQSNLDFSTVTANSLMLVYTTGASRRVTDVALPIRYDLDGVIPGFGLTPNYTTHYRMPTHHGFYLFSSDSYLETPDATNATTVEIATQQLVSGLISATMTFAAGSNVPTAYAYIGGKIPLFNRNTPANSRIRIRTTPGGAAVAGLHVILKPQLT
jgi:hypothetical protein